MLCCITLYTLYLYILLNFKLTVIGANGPHGMIVARLVAQGKRQEHEFVITPLQLWMEALVWEITEMKRPATLTAVQVATF